MTASNFQAIPPGPVQLIGLPRAAMGVTNARVLHRRLLVNNNNNSVGSTNAKRCLFGAPKPGEIQEMFDDHIRKNRDRFLKRYNFDIFTEKFVNKDDIIRNNDDVNVNSTNNLNEENDRNSSEEDTDDNEQSCNNSTNNFSELEERLRSKRISPNNNENDDDDEKYSLSTSSLQSISNSSNDHRANDSCDVTTCNLDDDSIHLLAVENDNNNTTANQNNASHNKKYNKSLGTKTIATTAQQKDKKINERLKPYSRQILLTDYYNTRKLLTSKTNAIIVRQLPKPQKAGLHEKESTTHQQQQKKQQQSESEDVV